MPLLPIAKILARAAMVRHKAGYLDAEPPYHTHQIIKAAFPDVIVAGAELGPSIIELAEARGGRRVLWYNRDVSNGQRRIGLAHGLHHFLTDLRWQPGTRECNVGLRSLESVRRLPTDGNEIGCDLFGGELLAPFDVIDRYVPRGPMPPGGSEREAWLDKLDHLESVFEVTREFIRWRVHDLMLLRQTHFFIDG